MLRITKTVLLWIFILTLFPPALQLGAEAPATGMDGSEDEAVSSPAPETRHPGLPHSDLLLVPETVPIGLFFHHGKVSVKGTLPEGCDGALIVQAPNQEMKMSIRGKRFGLWMAVGTAVFENAPAFYQCLTSKPIAGIASPETALENGIGFEKLKAEMELEVEKDGSEAEDKGVWKDEFVRFKESTGVFSVEEGALTVATSRGNTERIEGEIILPARSPEGSYRVTLLGFKDGNLVARVEETLSIHLENSVGFLRDLAFQHGWIYGIVAVIVALLAGFGVGALMPSKGGSH
jgi:uncharacterized protein (TIGR02186 family)